MVPDLPLPPPLPAGAISPLQPLCTAQAASFLPKSFFPWVLTFLPVRDVAMSMTFVSTHRPSLAYSAEASIRPTLILACLSLPRWKWRRSWQVFPALQFPSGLAYTPARLLHGSANLAVPPAFHLSLSPTPSSSLLTCAWASPVLTGASLWAHIAMSCIA